MSRKHLQQGVAKPPVNSDVIRIYSMRYCPFAERTLLVLAAKGVDYEIVNCNLSKKPEFLLEMNPAGRVPVLEYKGNVIPESLVVSDLLDDLFPDKPLKSKDPFQRARDRLAVEEFGKIMPFNVRLTLNPDDAEAKEGFQKALREFQNVLSGKKTDFFAGDQYGLVDLMLWPFFERFLLRYENALDFVPVLKAWTDRMGDVPAVQACRLPKDEMLRYYAGYPTGNLVYDLD